MAVPTIADFRTRFPETATAPDPVLQSHIDAAALQTPESVWGVIHGEGILYLARHTLWLDPNAQDMAARPDGKQAESVWLKERGRLARQVGGPSVSSLQVST